MGRPVLRRLYDALTITEYVRIACGASGSLDEALSLLRLVLDAAREGRGVSPAMLESIVSLLYESLDELEERGCLEAYKLEDAIVALESLRLVEASEG